jgi:hypothetical protein
MRAPAQGNLFASRGEISVDGTFGTATRTTLDARSWVEVVPAWLSGADSLFERLATVVPWKEHYRCLFDRTFLEPRLTAEYRDVRDAPEPVAAMADVLSAHYHVRYDSVWLNLYRDGRDGTGLHRDRFSCQTAGVHRSCPQPGCDTPIPAEAATWGVLDRLLAAVWRLDRDGWSMPAGVGARCAQDARDA